MDSVTKNITIVKAVLINGGARYITAALTILTTAVLSRILEPKDFGMIAIITVFTTFFNTISDIGIGPAVIQYQDLNKEDINDIYCFSFYIAILFSVIFSMIAFPISKFYQNEDYRPVCYMLSVSVFFATLNSVPNALLLKEKKFLTIGVRTIITSLVSSLFAIIFAFLGLKYYALVFQTILMRTVTYFWNKRKCAVYFKMKFKLRSIQIIWKYSSYQFAFNFVNYFSRNMDNLLIGKIFGNQALAFYDKGYTLLMYPVQAVTGVITPVLHPIMVDYHKKIELLYKQYLAITTILLMAGMFLTVFCFWGSRELILLLFGPQWELAVGSFRMLSLSLWAQLLISSTGTIYQVVNNTKLLFMNGLIGVVIILAAIFSGIWMGDIVSVAGMVSLAYTVQLFITFYIMSKYAFYENSFGLIKYLIKECVPGIVLFLLINRIPLNGTNYFWVLIQKFMICIISFGIYFFTTGKFRIIDHLKKEKH